MTTETCFQGSVSINASLPKNNPPTARHRPVNLDGATATVIMRPNVADLLVDIVNRVARRSAGWTVLGG